MTCISYPGTLCTRMHANRVIWLLSNLIPEKFRLVFLEKLLSAGAYCNKVLVVKPIL